MVRHCWPEFKATGWVASERRTGLYFSPRSVAAHSYLEGRKNIGPRVVLRSLEGNRTAMVNFPFACQPKRHYRRVDQTPEKGRRARPPVPPRAKAPTRLAIRAFLWPLPCQHLWAHAQPFPHRKQRPQKIAVHRTSLPRRSLFLFEKLIRQQPAARLAFIPNQIETNLNLIHKGRSAGVVDCERGFGTSK